MAKPVHIVAINLALAQVTDAVAKLEAAHANVTDVLASLGIEHPCAERIGVAHGAAQIAKAQLDTLCKRFPR